MPDQTTQVGTAVIFGITGDVAVGTGAVLTQINVEQQANKHQSKNKSGNTLGVVCWDKRFKVTAHYYPTGDSPTAIPTIGSRIAVTGCGPAADGNYIYEGGGTLEFTQEGVCKQVLPLMRYPGIP